ncbi:MAG: glycosyltransferase family 2 protein [Flavobacteriaceae bacterium]|nr:glycosyltransferase family 2 protein [Flavobacteriaceae bacterium]NNK74190.1 glycosyltransferase family 2 protein [Flavobacteriaceae bacterium]
MKLSVIILNYNVRHFLELCLDSVSAAIGGLDAEIIVVDNNSTDDSCKMVTEKFPKVKLISNTDNLGFAKGNNQGAQAATGEYICILNPDTVVAEDSFLTLLEFADGLDDLGALGCQLIDGSGRFLGESKRNIPGLKVAALKLMGQDRGYYARHLKPGEIGQVDILVGAYMLMKRHVFEAVGGFDERYFMYGEDIDLSYTLLKQGYKNYYHGQTVALHFKGESTRKDKVYRDRFYEAMLIFYKKHFNSGGLLMSIVKAGLNVASVFRRPPKAKPVQHSSYVYLGEKPPHGLKALWGDKLEIVSDIKTVKPGTTLVLNPEEMTFKDVITIMQVGGKLPVIRFKIMLKTSAFIIGSHDPNTKGEVIEIS